MANPNPNKSTRWKKGKSGNPKGRPPVAHSIAGILREIGEEPAGESGKSKIEVVMRSVYKHAVDGESWAVAFIADRTEGKPKQSVDVNQSSTTVIFQPHPSVDLSDLDDDD